MHADLVEHAMTVCSVKTETVFWQQSVREVLKQLNVTFNSSFLAGGIQRSYSISSLIHHLTLQEDIENLHDSLPFRRREFFNLAGA